MSEGDNNHTIIVGLSGPSSSGKTTLARLLRTIFNVDTSPETNHPSLSLFILHEDDFYKTDEEIPIVTATSTDHGTRHLQDWDCADSLDLALFESTLKHISRHGRLPPDLHSKEDQNAIGDSGVPDSIIANHKSSLIKWLHELPQHSSPSSPTPPSPGETQHITLCILDGFLLYPSPSPSPSIPSSITSLLDLKLFLRSTRDLTISRRARRSGYVTLEGFWTDPPGYVEDVVWPNYLNEHGWMFEDGDVDAGRIRDVAGRNGEGIEVGPGMGEAGMQEVLNWGVEVLREEVERVFRGEEDERR